MGSFNVMITLKNAIDVAAAERGYIQPQAVREIEVSALVDTGAMTLVINEETRLALGLNILEPCPVTVANGNRLQGSIAEAVNVHWQGRSMTCRPLVLPCGNILLGSIPLENMDLMADVVNQKLVGVHGDTMIMTVV
jgi:hypothetical protein